MDIREYVSIVKKRIWLILLIVAVTTISAAVVTLYVLEPIYSSSITLFVNNSNQTTDQRTLVDYSDIMAGQFLVKDYREIVKSKLITSAVIDELKLKNITPQNLADNIEVSLKNETRVLMITVYNKDAVKARDIANTLGEVFKTKIKGLMKIENVEIIDKADVAKKASKPKTLTYIAVPFGISFVFAFLLIFFLEFIDDRVKKPEDLYKYDSKATVLGIIPDLEFK